MLKLYRKNLTTFSIVSIVIYVVLFSLADSVSESLGIQGIVTAPLAVVFATVLFVFAKKNKLTQELGLCKFQGRAGDYLYFIPLAVLMTVNLWNGVRLNANALETVLCAVQMICVGFIEELIFRSFLFRGLLKDNEKTAVIISSVTFGAGHIVNLLNGKGGFDTLLQIMYAVAIGFAFTVLFYKSKSLIPCIVTHSVFNSLSVFGVQGSRVNSVIIAVIVTVIAAAYGAFILRKQITQETQSGDVTKV